jgi:hypothetical protein
VVIDQPGADGMVAGAEVAKSAPDGYESSLATSTGVGTPSRARTCLSIRRVHADRGIGNFSFSGGSIVAGGEEPEGRARGYARANPGRTPGARSATATIAPTLLEAGNSASRCSYKSGRPRR